MDRPRSGLLVMDVQHSIVKGLGEHAEAYIDRVAHAVEAARQCNMPVMFIVVRFRKGYPELNPSNRMFSAIRERYRHTPIDENNEATQPVIEPKKNELVIAKKRVSAFAGSDLEMILGAQGITDLVLCGIATSGVVLSTLRYAADRDYRLTVLSDCCFDQDDEVHQVLLEKVFPRQAEVVSSDEWIEQIKQTGKNNAQ